MVCVVETSWLFFWYLLTTVVQLFAGVTGVVGLGGVIFVPTSPAFVGVCFVKAVMRVNPDLGFRPRLMVLLWGESAVVGLACLETVILGF